MYDVYCGAERKAWGLKDKRVAQRWLARLAAAGGGEQEAEVFRPLEEAAVAEADDRAGAVAQEAEDAPPRRVWWNE